MKLSQRKKIAYKFLISAIVLTSAAKAQVPPADLYIVNSNSPVGGVHTYTYEHIDFKNYSGLIATEPTDISNTAEINYLAGEKVQLKDGFHAGAFSGNGYFHAGIERNDFPVQEFDTLFSWGPGWVQEYGKLEYGLDLPSDIDALLADYFTNRSSPTGINPFDPDDINIVATFTSPSGIQDRVVYGFYYEPFISAGTVWIAPASNNYNFRVRFAPTEVGEWKCSISVNSPNHKFSSTYTANNLHFTCIQTWADGQEKGYLQVGRYKRQLKYSYSGASFFAIGQNIPWIHHNAWNTNDFVPSEFDDLNDNVQNLADNEGNMVRLVLAPYSHQIEWERLGDYSDYISTSGQPQTRQHNAYELDKFFKLCHDNKVFVNLVLDLQDTHHNNGTETLYQWQNNPYKTQLGLGDPVDFLTNADAIKYFKRKLRYIIARWGYETSLGIIELLSEQDNWGIYDANFQYVQVFWHNDMTNYIRNVLGEPNHLLSTSFMNREDNLINSFNLTRIDVTSAHKYASKREMNKERFDIMNKNSVSGSHPNGLLIDYDKPSIYGEMGFTGDPPTTDPNDIEGCSDVSFHNSIWATAFSNTYGAGLNWQQSDNSAYRENFGPLHQFFKVPDFTTAVNRIFEVHRWIPEYWKEFRIPLKDYRMEVFSMHTSDRGLAWGWAHNATFWWGNIVPDCTDKAGNTERLPDDNDSQSTPVYYTGEQIPVEGLSLLAYYTFDWHNTRGNSYPTISSVFKRTNIFGHFKTTIPAGADYAFKMYRLGVFGFRGNDSLSNMIPPDTLLCGQDTIHIGGMYADDTAGIYHYTWNFGNGQMSDLPNPTVVYDQPGTYNVSLIVVDNDNKRDTLQQQIVVPNCDSTGYSSRTFIASALETSGRTINIVPNPNNGEFIVTVLKNNERIGVKEVAVFDLLGRTIWHTGTSSNNTFSIDISSYSKGVYYIRIVNELGDIDMKKLIKE